MLLSKVPRGFNTFEALDSLTAFIGMLLDRKWFTQIRQGLKTDILSWMPYTEHAISVIADVDAEKVLFVIRPEGNTLIVEGKLVNANFQLVDLYAFMMIDGVCSALDLLPDREEVYTKSQHELNRILLFLAGARDAFVK